MRLFVTGTGMTTSVGRDTKTACASIRAGIMRARGIEFYSMDEDSHEAVQVAGCPVTPLTDGFGNVGRWNILGKLALEDLAKSLGEKSPEYWKKTGIVFALPFLDDANFDFEGVVERSNVLSQFVGPFLEQCNIPFSTRARDVVCEGNTSVITACEKVKQMFSISEDIERVVVLAVDSLLEKTRLNWLSMQGRLKANDNPVGLMPGEAASALLFEREECVSDNILVRIYSHGTEQEANDFYSEEVNAGEGMTRSVRKTFDAVQLPEAYNGYLFSDLNGEEWRARELAMAKLNLGTDRLGEHIEEIIPAFSLGDVGAAYGACCICMLVQSRQRQYAISTDAVILASTPEGIAGSMLVKAY